jgi:molybdate-binding protein/DNA-binding transcriptional regulator YhcF (GntR family)
MEEPFLYHQVADAIRQKILRGELKPGDRLPSVRAMKAQWGCTVGTVQHAYQELARQGLVTSRAGQGTRVVDRLPVPDAAPLRTAALLHRAEAFLLEVLTAGYAPAEAEEAVRLALDRWRAVERQAAEPAAQSARFVGSHDLVVAWLATHFGDIAPGYVLQLTFAGSLGGLIALAEGKADLAGCHLWDEESDTYNLPFVRRLLPGRRTALVTVAYRQLGLMMAPGNPAGVRDVRDVARLGLRFVNRQSGSGTRVWLDATLRKLGIAVEQVRGYAVEVMTHSEVARAVADGQADAGLGLEAAARVHGLDFVALTRERYDLAIPASKMEAPPMRALLGWLGSPAARTALASLAGYDLSEAGQVLWSG